MKVYIINDNDIELLLAQLAIEKFEGAKYVQADVRTDKPVQDIMNAVHKRFHYEVSVWLSGVRK